MGQARDRVEADADACGDAAVARVREQFPDPFECGLALGALDKLAEFNMNLTRALSLACMVNFPGDPVGRRRKMMAILKLVAAEYVQMLDACNATMERTFADHENSKGGG